MDIENLVTGAAAEFLNRKLILNAELVSPVETAEPKAVHSLWPLAKNASQALYVLAVPDALDDSKIHVTARVKQYHPIKEEIRKGVHGPEYNASDLFLRQTRVSSARELIDDLLPAFTAYHERK